MAQQLDFEALFREYYQPLGRYIMPVVRDSQAADDVLQELFTKLWEKREELRIQTSLKSYLYKAAWNYALNHVKRHNRETARSVTIDESTPLAEAQASPQVQERAERVKMAIDALPERCREVFLMAKVEGYAYKEIAAKLDISVKTVENQMGKALKIIREFAE